YRYFPETDVVPLYIDNAWKNRIKELIPELPDKRKARFMDELQLSEYDAANLTGSKEMADFFEATVESGADVKQASNWLMGDVSGYMNKHQLTLQELSLTSDSLGKMIQLIED